MERVVQSTGEGQPPVSSTRTGGVRELACRFVEVCVVTFLLTRLPRLGVLGEWLAPWVGVGLAWYFLSRALHWSVSEIGLTRAGLGLGRIWEGSQQAGGGSEAANALGSRYTAATAHFTCASKSEDWTQAVIAAARRRARGVAVELRALGASLARALPAALREGGYALMVCALVFPAYGWAYATWVAPDRPFALRWPQRPFDFAVAQLLVVALPEEALFRGYFLGHLAAIHTRCVRVLGVDIPWVAVLLQALAFGVVHALVDLNPWRMLVSVPALLFAWVRCWRDGLGACIWLHAWSNLLGGVLARGWAPEDG